MRNQHPGAPQPQLRQPSGVNDMQLWQQQILYKQFQDYQRQQQLQLDQGARQQNPLNQLIAKQASADQLPVVGNGITSNHDSSYGWQGEVMGSESKVANASQMFISGGEANWAQHRGSGMSSGQSFPNGLMISQDQRQPLRTIGFVPQQHMDQSLYGAPVAVARGSVLSQYNHSQGTTQVGSEMLNRVGGIVGDKPTKPSAFNTFQNDEPTSVPSAMYCQEGFSTTKQNFQEKNLFSQIPLQTYTNSVPENLQQETFSNNSLTASLHGRHDHVSWAGPTKGKPAAQVGSSQEAVSLDPTEAKILFGTDDGIWHGSFSRNDGGLQGSQFGGADYFNAFPSLQCGSWSALMQSAVAETSSGDTGMQDEWSGLNFPKEVPSGNNTALVDNNMQQSPSLSSKPSPLSFEPKSNSSYLQQTSTRFPYTHDGRLRVDAMQESRWTDHGLSQKSEGGFEVGSSMQVQNAPEGNWMGDMNDRLNTVVQSTDMGATQNELRPWAHQQHSFNTDTNKLNGGWNVSEIYPAGVDSPSVVHNRAMYAERSAGSNMWKSNDNNLKAAYANATGGLDHVKLGTGSPHMQAENPFHNRCASASSSDGHNVGQGLKVLVDKRSGDYSKHVLADPSESYRAQENLSRYQQQMSRSPQESSMNNSDQASGETCEKKKEMSSDSYMSGRSHSGQHPLTVNSQRDNSWLNANDSVTTNSQKPSSHVGRKNALAIRKFQYHPMGNLAIESGDSLRHTSNPPTSQPVIQENIQDQGLVWPKFTSSMPNTVTDREKGNACNFQESCKGMEELPSRSSQPGQHMLELLQKVDHSRERSTAGHFVSSDQNQLGVPAPLASDCPPSHRYNAPQNFGLNLVSSSQQVLLAKSQNLGSFNSRQGDLGVGKSRLPLLSPQDANSSYDKPQGDTSNRSGVNFTQPVSDASYSQSRVNSDHPWPMHQIPRQVEGSSGQLMKDMPDFNQQNKLTSLSGHHVRIQDVASSNLAAQGSFHGPGRIQGLDRPPHSLNTKSLYMRGSDQTDGTHSATDGAFSKMFHNVRTISACQKQGNLANQISSNAVQSITTTCRNSETAHWSSQNTDSQNMPDGGNGPSELGPCAVKSQPFGYYEEQKPDNYSFIPMERSESPSLVPTVGIQPPLHPPMTDRSYQESLQTENASLVISNATEASGASLRQNYSLLHQVQAMKDLDDPNRNMKRLKGVESNFDGQQMAGSTNEPFLYGFSRGSIGSEGLSAGKMLCFSSEVKEDTSANHLSQPQVGDSANVNYSHLNVPSSASGRSLEHIPNINPQMASSWFEQDGSYKNGQILSVYDGLDSSKRLANSAGPQFFYGKPADKMQATASLTAAEQGKAPSFVLAESDQLSTPQPSSSLVVDHSVAIVRPKKRKIGTSDILPWHKEIAQVFQRLQTISEAEQDWSQASNRRIEKLEDEMEMVEGRMPISRPRRRITLTTQLMQQLLQALPSSIFSANAFLEYETVVFHSARLALGDACSLVSCCGSDRRDHSTSGNTLQEKQEATVCVGFYSKVVEDFIGRAKKLENVLMRLDKGYSPADMRVECQDLEKFSIINRFAKFHGRGNADVVDGSSSSDAMVRKPVPQRYVTAYPMPRSLPEGVLCLSL